MTANDDVEVGATAVASRGDPFELREGKTLTWKNINMSVVRT